MKSNNILILYLREMVVGWQYTYWFIRRGYDWFFSKEKILLLDQIGFTLVKMGTTRICWQASVRSKTATNTNKHHGEQYDSPAEKRVYYFEDQRSYHTLKLVGFYDNGDWYYLQKDGGFDSRINRLPVGR